MNLVVAGYTEERVYGGREPYWDTAKLSQGLRTFALSTDGVLAPASSDIPAGGARPNPSWVEAHPSGLIVYSMCESSTAPLGTATDVVAHAVDPETAALTLINRAVCGEGPCFATLDKSAKFLLVSCINSSEVVVFSILPNGGVGAVVERQSVRAALGLVPTADSNAHSVVLSPSNELAVVSDMALARVLVYRFDSTRGALNFHSSTESGPWPGGRARHFVFHPFVTGSGETPGLAFGMNQGKGGVDEGSVSVYHVHHRNVDADAAHGKPVLELVQRISSLPAGHVPSAERPAVGGAAIRISPDARHVYCSNRGHDSIAIFAVNIGEEGGDGLVTREPYLTLLGHEPCGGRTPRDIAIDPTGSFLLAANQDSHAVITFEIQQPSGLLRRTGNELAVAAPNCICFLPAQGAAGGRGGGGGGGGGGGHGRL
eukprot:COSAG05_NODE_2129_length_3516_cov_3.306612_3_plen_429_part_00